MLLLTIQTVKLHGHESLSTNGLNSARMRMEMTFLKLSSAVSIHQNGKQVMSLIIRLMMRRMDDFMLNTKNLQIRN